MNGETAKLLRKASQNRKHYKKLKSQWKKMNAPERTSAREKLIKELVRRDNVFIPDAWKRKAGVLE